MTEHEVIEILHKSLHCLERNNLDGFDKLIRLAELMSAEFPNADELRGEMALLRAMSRPVKGNEMSELLKQASALIKTGRSRIIAQFIEHVENHFDAFMMWRYEPGNVDEILRETGLIAEASLLPIRIFGESIGIYEYYMAHVAYYRGRFDVALEHACKCYELNDPDRDEFSIMHSLCLEILAGVGKHNHDDELWRYSYSMLKRIVDGSKKASRACREQAQVICAMLDMSLGCLRDVPEWLRTGEFGVIPTEWGFEMIDDKVLAGTLPCAMVAHVEYLCYKGEPEKALRAAGLARNVFKIDNLILTAYLELLCAACYHQLSKHNLMNDAITRVINLIAPDGLWLLIAEFGHVFGNDSIVLNLIEGMPEHFRNMDKSFMDRIAPLRGEVVSGMQENLTKREQEIALLVIKGHSNAEIAEELHITVRTVRAHLEHIYQKLNVTRRSKLVNAMQQTGGLETAIWMK